MDLSCWWLARLDNIGPDFALAIMGTGAIVGVGLMLQVVLSLFNMYRWPGKVVLLLLFAATAAGGVSSHAAGPRLSESGSATTRLAVRRDGWKSRRTQRCNERPPLAALR